MRPAELESPRASSICQGSTFQLFSKEAKKCVQDRVTYARAISPVMVNHLLFSHRWGT